MLIGVYIPPHASADVVIGELANQVTAIENSLPDSHVLVQGDFNHMSLKEEFPKYKQEVKCAAREGNTLDHCYRTISDAYHAVPLAPLVFSDHSMIVLLPSYRQKLKTEKPQVRYVRCWNSDSLQILQGCLDCTAWDSVKNACEDIHEYTGWDSIKNACEDIHEYTDVVTSCIHFCEDRCIPTRKLKSFANDTPWFTGSLTAKLKAKEDAYKSGDRALCKKAKCEVQIEYRRKLENQFLANNTRAVWKGMQTITGYHKKCSTTFCNDPQLLDDLNEFYGRFGRQNTTPVTASPLDPATPLLPSFIVEESAALQEAEQQESL